MLSSDHEPVGEYRAPALPAVFCWKRAHPCGNGICSERTVCYVTLPHTYTATNAENLQTSWFRICSRVKHMLLTCIQHASSG